MGWTKKKDKWHCFFLWENWEHPKPSFKFLVGDQTLRFLEVRTGMTNLSPSTTSPEPGSPQPAGAFNWRLSEENSWPTQRQATDPSGPTTDDRSTNKKNWSLCTLPLPRLRPIWCHFVLSYTVYYPSLSFPHEWKVWYQRSKKIDGLEVKFGQTQNIEAFKKRQRQRQRQSYWKQLSDLVTRLTIPDKQKNLSQDFDSKRCPGGVGLGQRRTKVLTIVVIIMMNFTYQRHWKFAAYDEVQPGTTHFVNNFLKVSTHDSICARVRAPVQGESSALRF